MKNDTNIRVKEVDIAKGIGILLVIIGHSVPYGSQFYRWIYSFHMPLFFILSGLVMSIPENMSFRTLCRKNIKLISNYILWTVVYFIFDLIVRLVMLHQASFHSMFWEGYQALTLYGINVLWFFSTLCISKIMATVVLKKIDQRAALFVGIGLYAFSVLVSNYINQIELNNYSSIFVYPATTIIRSFSVVIFLIIGFVLKSLVSRSVKLIGGGNASLSVLPRFY